MRSHLLEGIVRHRRTRPFTYAFEHKVFYFALDLSELDVVARLRLVSRDRRNFFTFRDDDHFDPPSTDLNASVGAHLRSAGFEPEGWHITLITNLRVIGYVFNPASFYLCRDRSGTLQVVVVEVHNTHGERHQYTLRSEEGDGERFVASMDKAFYVSPFIAAAGRYAVSIRDEKSRLRITINEQDEGTLLLHTSLDLARHRLTDRTAARMLVRYPMGPHRTIGMIHWHALQLWRRGLRVYRHRAAVR